MSGAAWNLEDPSCSFCRNRAECVVESRSVPLGTQLKRMRRLQHQQEAVDDVSDAVTRGVLSRALHKILQHKYISITALAMAPLISRLENWLDMLID